MKNETKEYNMEKTDEKTAAALTAARKIASWAEENIPKEDMEFWHASQRLPYNDFETVINVYTFREQVNYIFHNMGIAFGCDLPENIIKDYCAAVGLTLDEASQLAYEVECKGY